MDGLKSATQVASDASTLGSGKRMLGFITCSMAGVVCLILTCGVLTLCAAFWWSKLGLVFSFSIVGHLLFSWCSPAYVPFVRKAISKMVETCSEILSNCIDVLTGQLKQLTRTRLLAIIICLLLTLCAAFWWMDVGVRTILMMTRLALSGVMLVFLG